MTEALSTNLNFGRRSVVEERVELKVCGRVVHVMYTVHASVALRVHAARGRSAMTGLWAAPSVDAQVMCQLKVGLVVDRVVLRDVLWLLLGWDMPSVVVWWPHGD